MLPVILFGLSEIVFGGMDASFALRGRTQVHLRHPKEEFITNEDGSKGNENIHHPAVIKGCLSPAEGSSLNFTSMSHKRTLWS